MIIRRCLNVQHIAHRLPKKMIEICPNVCYRSIMFIKIASCYVMIIACCVHFFVAYEHCLLVKHFFFQHCLQNTIILFILCVPFYRVYKHCRRLVNIENEFESTKKKPYVLSFFVPFIMFIIFTFLYYYYFFVQPTRHTTAGCEKYREKVRLYVDLI